MRILDKQPVASKSINKVYATFDSDENMAEFLKTVKKFYFLNFKKKEEAEWSDSYIRTKDDNTYYILNPFKIYKDKDTPPQYHYLNFSDNEYGYQEDPSVNTDIQLINTYGKESFSGEKVIKEPPYLYTNITFGNGIYLECAYEEK